MNKLEHKFRFLILYYSYVLGYNSYFNLLKTASFEVRKVVSTTKTGMKSYPLQTIHDAGILAIYEFGGGAHVLKFCTL